MFCYRIKKYIGAYVAVLGVVDAIVLAERRAHYWPRFRVIEGEETIIGGGGYIMNDPQGEARRAEIAFTIEKGSQGQRIASSLTYYFRFSV